ncbi:site-2 protease family protein [Neorhodopirellula pilleata]|uniref:HlyD family secretion protein n=1 Tax=Neorhodopirellula pilleata TaxID=2714738 RepID=A0A5C6AHN6_9BACT|nr:site-2 protease family protein [Neorhodopirellula pilleata]TWT98936.1 HlyD family secretion protein [Neorhodopirellula pilleata]
MFRANDTHRSSTERPLAVRHQVGLKAVRISHRHAGWVNVEDPVAGKYHRLREDEYFLLCQLDGRRSLENLRTEYQTRYPNRRVSAAQINALLLRFHECGLTISYSLGQGDPLLLRADRQRRQKWLGLASQWLFIRFPGVDPAPVMRWLSPLVRPLLSPLGLAIASAFIVSAGIAILVHSASFVRELPSASQWLTYENAIGLAVVVALTKVAHELGHAAVSERMGARCRSIGAMLLVGTPALYCDTSASWMLPSRWKRAAVGLAGIATEVLIASAAIWIWLITGPGWWHTTAAHVIVVCGISTVVFNANPLLRYDGYYVLSDLTDTPNLGQRANRRLSSTLARICLGVGHANGSGEPADRSVWMLVYAIAALMYRWMLMFAIVGFIWISLRPYGLEVIGQFAAIFASASMIIAAAMPLIRFLRHPAQRRKIRVTRLACTSLVVAALIVASLVPYASDVVVTARLIPQTETRVFAPSAGQLVKWYVRPGQHVAAGDLIAELRNPSLQSKWIDADGRLKQHTIRMETLRQSQTLVPEAAEHLAAADETLTQLRDELAAIERQKEGLSIKSPADGVVVAAPGNPTNAADSVPSFDDSVLDPDADRLPSLSRDDIRMTSWMGHPTDPENVDCFFETGTELLSVAAPHDWAAEAPVDAATAARITVGAEAEIIWDAEPQRVVFGRVAALSDERFAPTLDSIRRDHPASMKKTWTPETRFMVKVDVDWNPVKSPTSSESSDSAGGLWRVGSSGRLKISLPPRSLAKRLADAIASVVRFR